MEKKQRLKLYNRWQTLSFLTFVSVAYPLFITSAVLVDGTWLCVSVISVVVSRIAGWFAEHYDDTERKYTHY